MPLQQIQLDQSIYQREPWKKPQWGASRRPPSPVSEALRTQPQAGGMTAEQRYAPGFVDRQKEEWAMEDKLKKEERDAKVKEAQEMGMRIRAAHQETIEKAKAQSAKMKADIETMAMEAYEFAVEGELDDASRQNILRALKAKPKAYDVLQKKGLIMADGSDFVKKAGEPMEEEWYYNAEDNLMYNRKTAETIKMDIDMPEGADPDMIKDAFTYGSAHMGRLMDPTILEKISSEKMAVYIENARKESHIATETFLLGQGVEKQLAHDIAYGVPIGERGKKEEGEERVGMHKNWDAPLDEEKAKGMAEFWRANPDMKTPANIEANRDKYGDATTDKALKLDKATEPSPSVVPLKVEPTVETAPLTTSPSAFEGISPSAFKGKAPSAFNKWQGL